MRKLLYLERLIEALSSLPGISRRLARNIALDVIYREELLRSLSFSFKEALDKRNRCDRCGFLMDEEGCPICDDPSRRKDRLCLVPDALTLYVLEENSLWDGLYFILGGLIDPSMGITPDDLRLTELLSFLKDILKGHPEAEVCFALDSTVEGEITVRYICEYLENEMKENLMFLKLTKLSPVPSGARIFSLAPEILKAAVQGREEISG